MKPNFALSLSEDGICLMRRSGTRWMEVGEAQLDDTSLSDRLRMLRTTAADLAAGGFSTKLVIPDSQILYRSFQAPGPRDTDRARQIRAQLEGLTPYPVEDLVYDWVANGDEVRVAVVARETLDEAEGFASEHRFNPVSYVAAPDPAIYPAEPFFGPTRFSEGFLDKGEIVERDRDIVQMPGRTPSRPAPASPPPPTPRAAPAQAPAPTPRAAAPAKPPATAPAPAKPAPPAQAAPPPKAPEPPAPRKPSMFAAFGRKKPAQPPKPDPAAGPEDAAARPASAMAAAIPAKSDIPAPVETGPNVSFSTRRTQAGDAKTDAPKLDRVTARIAMPSATPPDPAPAPKPKGLSAALAAKPDEQAREKAPPPAAAKPAAPSGPATSRMAKVDPPLPRAKPPLVAEQDPFPLPRPGDPPSGGLGSRLAGLKDKTPRIAAPSLTGLAGKLGPALGAMKSRAVGAKAPITQILATDTAPPPKPEPAKPTLVKSAAQKPAAKPDPSRPEPPKPALARPASPLEAQAMTRFGERGQEPGFARRHMGLILTGGLIGLMALVALWSVFFLGDEVEIVPQVVDVPEMVLPSETPTGTGSGPVGDTSLATPSDTAAPLAPSEPLDAPAAPDTAPPIVAEPPLATAPADPQDSTQLPRADTDAAVEQALAPPETGETGEPVETIPPEAPEAPATPTVTEGPMTREEAEALYAATGLWTIEPEPSASPSTDRLDDLYITSIDPVIASQDAVALPPPSDSTADAAPTAPPPPGPPGTVYDLDERGLVRATPGGAVSPDGVVIYSGPPPVVPAPRPENLAPEAAPPAPDERLREIRPQLRPESLIESNERTRFGGRSLTELAAIRPTPRPDDLAAPVTAEAAAAPAPVTAEAAAAPAPDPAALESATQLAVANSPQPRLRPTAVAERIAALRAERETAAIDASTDPSASLADEPELENVAVARLPSIPTTASVAREATVENAIRLGEINLIGVFGSSADRRALVRLPSGRYVRVKVGDRVDGGQVAAIGEDELRYIKSGRNITLELPSG